MFHVEHFEQNLLCAAEEQPLFVEPYLKIGAVRTLVFKMVKPVFIQERAPLLELFIVII